MNLNALAASAVEAEDLTKDVSFTRELHPAGPCLLRLRDYIELGIHEPKNPQHKNSEKVILVFESLHPKHMIEIDGEKVPQTIQVRLSKGKTAKSGFKKLFKQMNAALDNSCTHIVQMIGKPFKGTVYHNDVGEGDQKKTYANLDQDGAYSITKAVKVDDDTLEETPINVPEMHGEPKVFLWEYDTCTDDQIKEMWDSIFIEGTRTEGEGANAKEVSKNWIQDTIKKSVTWNGSRTQALVEEFVGLDELEGGAEGAATPAAQEQAPAAQAQQAAEQPAQAAAAQPEQAPAEPAKAAEQPAAAAELSVDALDLSVLDAAAQ